MRWPFMLKSTHEAEIDHLSAVWQEMVDQEFDRATAQGRAAVHRWAVDANYNVFTHGNPRGAASAAFQEAERMFAPVRPDVKEVLQGAQ
jgi:hypothetical protein